MKLKLAHISLGMGIGGIEQTIVHLTRGLDPERFDITVGCLDHGGALLDSLGQAAFFVENRAPGLDFRLIQRLAARFRKGRYQMVHTHNQAAQFYAGIAARLARVPVLVCTEHSRHHIQGVSRRILEKRLLCRISDRWVTVSQALYEASAFQDRLPPSKLAMVPNGVPLNPGPADPKAIDAIRETLGISRSDRMIFMAARLDPVKNHGLMLETLAMLKQDSPRVHLVLAGEGGERQRLETRARDLGISGQVRFLGGRNDVPDLLLASDLFVLCSVSEGLPLSLLEAAGAGVPLLVTPGANKAGFLENGVNGTVADAAPEAMAEAMRKILAKEPDPAVMTGRARQKVAEAFSVRAMVRAYERLYLDLAQQKGVF